MLQFKLPAAHSVRVPAGEAHGFSSLRPSMACCLIRPQKNDGLQDSPRAGCPCGKGGDGCEKPTSQLNTCVEGKVIEIRNFLEWGDGTLVCEHQVRGSGFRGRGFDTRGCFLVRLPSSQLRGCCGFGLRLLRPGRLPGGGLFRLLGSFRDRLGRGISNRGWWGSGLDNTPPRTT